MDTALSQLGPDLAQQDAAFLIELLTACIVEKREKEG